MKNKVDILSMIYSSKGRDIDIVEPVLCKVEKDLKLNVKRTWLYENFVFDILKYRPKMLVQANAIGCKNHYWACKFASMLGIKVVTFTSEGDYRIIDNSLTTMLFGWNNEEHLYEDLHLEWSQRNIEYFKTSKGYNPDIVKLSGATGFDKYKLLKFMNKSDFLSKYKKTNYNKIVGLGGWTFDFIFNDEHSTGPIYFGEEKEGIKKSLIELREGYEYIVSNNPDILFVCKKHPLTENLEYDEFSSLNKYENVIIIQTEENIYDVINISDFWITFDSTTALEAWLLGKQTFLYNPVIQEFNRSSIAKGSPKITSKMDLQSICIEFYKYGKVRAFEKLEKEREYIINEVIGWSDGRNHERAADYIKELYIKKRVKIEKKNYFFIGKMLLLGVRNYLRSQIVRFKILNCFSRVKQFLKWRDSYYDNNERMYYVEKYRSVIR